MHGFTKTMTNQIQFLPPNPSGWKKKKQESSNNNEQEWLLPWLFPIEWKCLRGFTVPTRMRLHVEHYFLEMCICIRNHNSLHRLYSTIARTQIYGPCSWDRVRPHHIIQTDTRCLNGWQWRWWQKRENTIRVVAEFTVGAVQETEFHLFSMAARGRIRGLFLLVCQMHNRVISIFFISSNNTGPEWVPHSSSWIDLWSTEWHQTGSWKNKYHLYIRSTKERPFWCV